MVCSAHLLSQILYSSHASPAAPRSLRFQARSSAVASPGARPSTSAWGRRGIGLRAAASFDAERRQVEVLKALDLYRKKTGTDNSFWIHLDKKVPTGAGLGG